MCAEKEEESCEEIICKGEGVIWVEWLLGRQAFTPFSFSQVLLLCHRHTFRPTQDAGPSTFLHQLVQRRMVRICL